MSMKLRVRYFALLREQLEREEEALEVKQPIAVSQLIEQLRSRGDPWRSLLSANEKICVAVDQEMVTLSHELSRDAEVAFFRPVTGG